MIKKIAITTILLSLIFVGCMIAEERYTLDIYLTVNAAYNANTVEIGYMDIDHNEYVYHTVTVDPGTHIIHRQIHVWFPRDPAPEWVFAEGWGPNSFHDRDECDSNLYYPMELELWLGDYIDPTIPLQE